MKKRLLLLALLAALAAGRPYGTRAQESPPPPLTNEDVVRMVSQGRPETEILRIIAASPADFELDREMTEELRRAGVTERIIAAMRERQAAAGVRPTEAPPAAPAPALRGKLRVTFTPLDESGKDREASFRVVKKTPRWAIQRLGMEEQKEVEDLALFVACTTPDHVPDHWQDRTPVKDFARHEMLLFHPGSHPATAKHFEELSLDLPAFLDVDAPAGIHRLVVGVAAKIGPDWRPLASDNRPGVPVLAGKTTPIRVKLKGRLTGSGMSGFKEEQGLIIDGMDEPGEIP
jgi:hypothetical protein